MGGSQSRPLSRRQALTLIGGTVLAGNASNATAATSETQQNNTIQAYVGSYHWGYFVLDESGQERDQIRLTTGDELRLTTFNVEAEEALDALPESVRAAIPDSDERARRNQQAIPGQEGVDLDALHEAAEEEYPDHSLAIIHDDFLDRPMGNGRGPGGGQGPQGGHHGPGPHVGPEDPHGTGPHGPWWNGNGEGMLMPPMTLWHHSTVPSDEGFIANTPGSYGFVCTVYCGYGHPYMVEKGRVVVRNG